MTPPDPLVSIFDPAAVKALPKKKSVIWLAHPVVVALARRRGRRAVALRLVNLWLMPAHPVVHWPYLKANPSFLQWMVAAGATVVRIRQ